MDYGILAERDFTLADGSSLKLLAGWRTDVPELPLIAGHRCTWAAVRLNLNF